MSESFKGSSGRKVVSRASANEVGSVGHLLVDAQQRRVAAVVIGQGKKSPAGRLGAAERVRARRGDGGRRRRPSAAGRRPRTGRR